MIERVKNPHRHCPENGSRLNEHVPTVKPEKPAEIDPETGKGRHPEHKHPTDELATPLAHPLVQDPKRRDTEEATRQRERKDEPRVEPPAVGATPHEVHDVREDVRRVRKREQ